MKQTPSTPSMTETYRAPTPTSLYWQLAPNFISGEERNDQFQKHVSALRNAVSKSRAALQRSLTAARIVSKKYPPLRQVVPYRSNGTAFWIEMYLDPCLKYTFDRDVPLHSIQCPHCLVKTRDSILSSERIALYSTQQEQTRYFDRAHCRRVEHLATARKKYRHRLANVNFAMTNATTRISSAQTDLRRLSIQIEQVENGTYNTETEFMTKRQQNAVFRESMLFKTSSVHAFGQELELNKAQPALALEVDRATCIFNEKSVELQYLLTMHPLVVHSFSRLCQWLKFRLRLNYGKRARLKLKQRAERCAKSEYRVLYHLYRRLAAERIQRGWRCFLAKRILFRLRNIKTNAMARRVQKWWRKMLLRERRRLLIVMLSFLRQCVSYKIKSAWNVWWRRINILRRIEWLQRHARKTYYHLCAMKIQKQLKYYLLKGRSSFQQNVCINLHFTMKRILNECTVTNSCNAPYANNTASSAATLDRWAFSNCLRELERLQTRTRRIVQHGEMFFRYSRKSSNTTTSSVNKMYAMYDQGMREISTYFSNRYRGIGIRHSKWFHHGESYEWHIIQSIDRRYRACQFALDAITHKFDQHGHVLDLMEHRKLLREYLRAQDPRWVHEITRTNQLTSTYYFCWFFGADLSLCQICNFMIVRATTIENRTDDSSVGKCYGCGRNSYQRNKMGQTYSQILNVPLERIKKKRNKKITTDTKNNMKPGEMIDALPPLPSIITRERRPRSLSDIHVDSYPFLLHCHFWATAPKRFGKGRTFKKRPMQWNNSVCETKEWSQLLIKQHGVNTIAKLALWSVKRLISIGNVPEKTATTICLLLSMLQREMDKWSITQGNSKLLDKASARNIILEGESIETVPAEFLGH